MRYAYYPGCLAQSEQYGCLLSANEVLEALGVELLKIDGSSCCGYQSYRLSAPIMWSYLTVRNLALAERMGLDILTTCNDCYISFNEVKKQLAEDPIVRKPIAEVLKSENLDYSGKPEVKHIVETLHDEVGLERISKAVVNPLNKYRFAVQPGCHLIRPREIHTADLGEKLENLIKTLGAKVVDYPERLDCCGASMYSSEEESTHEVPYRKLRSVEKLALDGIITICPHCFKTLSAVQEDKKSTSAEQLSPVPVIHYTQLLGIAMGIDTMKLGLQYNTIPIDLIYQL